MSENPVEVEEGSIRVDREGAVASLQFAHRKANSLPMTLLSAIADTIRTLGDDPQVAAIVLRSDGPGSFCAGASFDEFKAIATIEHGHSFFMGFANVLLAMRECPKLIVCRVQGKAVGGGVGLIAGADYVCAHTSASVRLSEFELGIGPFTIGPAVERKIGLAAFTAMTIDTAWRDANWALAHGLYSNVLPTAETLDEVVGDLAGRLARADSMATREIKAMLWQGTEHWDALLPSRAKTSARLLMQKK